MTGGVMVGLVLGNRLMALATLMLSVMAACLVLAAAASAWRRSTSAERRAITRVAAGTPHAGEGRVHVSNIRVSTVGPWASATVAVYFDNEPDYAVDVLHKVHGEWRLTRHSPGTFGEQCGIGMPRKDQQNLGFAPCR